jgi:hypothetical protein
MQEAPMSLTPIRNTQAAHKKLKSRTQIHDACLPVMSHSYRPGQNSKTRESRFLPTQTVPQDVAESHKIKEYINAQRDRGVCPETRLKDHWGVVHLGGAGNFPLHACWPIIVQL